MIELVSGQKWYREDDVDSEWNRKRQYHSDTEKSKPNLENIK